MPTTIARHLRTEPLVVGVAGRIGAGKTSAARYLSSHYGFQYIRYSQVLSQWLAEGAESKSQLQDVGWQVMSGGRQTELNRRLIAKIAPGTDAAVDGLRHPIDYESLAKSFSSSFHLLYIDSPPQLRWERLMANGKYQTREAFEGADSHPVEQQIEKLRPNAQMVLYNEGSLKELYASIDTTILNLRSEGTG